MKRQKDVSKRDLKELLILKNQGVGLNHLEKSTPELICPGREIYRSKGFTA